MAKHLTIAVLGAGNIGGTLGRAWKAAGHQIAFGVRDPQGEKALRLRQELGETISIGTVAEALATNPERVVMAVPGGAMDATIAEHAAQLDGRIIIDTANRIEGVSKLSGQEQKKATELVKQGKTATSSLGTFQVHTPHAHIYRAFNSLG